jgi:hypothetical protein
MSGQPTTEELLNMSGGIDASSISENPMPAIAAPTEIPTESQSAIKRRLENSIEGFLESDTAAAQGGGGFGGAPNVQFSDTVQNVMSGNSTPAPMMIEESRHASPIDRFKAFIAIEKQLNPKFDVAKDLDEMIDYLIEQQTLEAKFARFNSPTQHNDEEETYNG